MSAVAKTGRYTDWEINDACSHSNYRDATFTVHPSGWICSHGFQGRDRGICNPLNRRSDLLDEIARIFLSRVDPRGGRIRVFGRTLEYWPEKRLLGVGPREWGKIKGFK